MEYLTRVSNDGPCRSGGPRQGFALAITKDRWYFCAKVGAEVVPSTREEGTGLMGAGLILERLVHSKESF